MKGKLIILWKIYKLYKVINGELELELNNDNRPPKENCILPKNRGNYMWQVNFVLNMIINYTGRNNNTINKLFLNNIINPEDIITLEQNQICQNNSLLIIFGIYCSYILVVYIIENLIEEKEEEKESLKEEDF